MSLLRGSNMMLEAKCRARRSTRYGLAIAPTGNLIARYKMQAQIALVEDTVRQSKPLPNAHALKITLPASGHLGLDHKREH